MDNPLENMAIKSEGTPFLKHHLRDIKCLHCNNLIEFTNGASIDCPNCNSHYPVINGIPVLINENESIFSFKDFTDQKNLFFDISRSGALKARVSSLLPSLSFNKISRQNFQYLSALFTNNKKYSVLILGGSIEGQGITEFLRLPNLHIVESDVSFGPRTQVILDAHHIPFINESFDCVIAQAVLEHVVDPTQCVSEMYRILKPGGIVYSEIPFMQQVHGGAYDFTRFSMSGHRRLFRRFEQMKAGALAGPGTTMGWSYTYLLISLFGFTPALKLFIKTFARLTAFWLKYFDHLTMHLSRTVDGASVTYFIGSKSDKTFTDKELISYYK